MSRHLLSLAVLLAALVVAEHPLAAQQGMGRRFSLSGRVTDAASNRTIEGVLVELDVFNGGIVNQVYTSANGEFDFGALPSDNYVIIVRRDGYEPVDQQVPLIRNTIGTLVELRPVMPDPNAPKGALVSARELSIPRKPHDEMQKGLALLYQKSDYAGSIAQFERAVKDYPNYYEAYAQMSVAYMKMKNPAKSEELLRKALAVSNERYVEGYCMLANLFTEQQRFADAAAAARKAVELDANSFPAQYELARALYGLNDLDGAQASAAAAAELEPNNADTYLVLANVHNHQHDYPKLVADLDAYLKITPNGAQADQARQTRDQIRQVLNRTSAPATP
jgi:cytochrome c-type biogenesis protein CcmH/NrfG